MSTIYCIVLGLHFLHIGDARCQYHITSFLHQAATRLTYTLVVILFCGIIGEYSASQ